MHPQRTFADVEYDGQPRQTRRERFLQRMDALMPWARLEARIRPVYPTGERGRPPYPLALLLRIHCVQLFYNLSDPGDGRRALRQRGGAAVCGTDGAGPRPDETPRAALGRNATLGVGPQHGPQGPRQFARDRDVRHNRRFAVLDPPRYRRWIRCCARSATATTQPGWPVRRFLSAAPTRGGWR